MHKPRYEIKFHSYTKTRLLLSPPRRFKTFATGTFPIGMRKLGINRDELQLPSVEEKAEEMLQFEDELYGAQRELRKLTKRKRKRVVADKSSLDELESKVRKIAKLKSDTSNEWVEEEQPQNVSMYSDDEDTAAARPASATNGKLDDVEAPQQSNNSDISVRKLKKKKVKNSGVVAKLNGSVENNEAAVVVETAQTNGVVADDKQSVNEKSPKKSAKSPKPTKSPKAATAKSTEWEEPLKEGEVEYVIPAKKFKGNVSITRIEGKATNGDVSHAATPIKLKSAAHASTPLSTPVNSASAAAAALSASLTSSRKKNVKIMLKMNKSQEAVEYMRQLKQSPSLPFDSKLKPPKGVLKPNLLPSPINPYYKKMIGMKWEFGIGRGQWEAISPVVGHIWCFIV